jgi:uncharacterized protein
MIPESNILKTTKSIGDLRINISKLSEGIRNYKLSTESKNVGLDDRFDKPIQLDVLIDKSVNQLCLKTKIETSGRFECDRCLEIFELPINSNYNMVYMYRQIPDIEQKSDEVKTINADTNYIDLTEDVREYILLALPIKTLCADNCAGLCPNCGTNLNTNKCSCITETHDGRWEPLSNLIKNTK